jgi:NTE family protein
MSAPQQAACPRLSGQVVLVLQGGGALGAYQAGVYQALHESGIEPDWVIGTSIGAINAALITGNRPGERLARLRTFWDRVERSFPGSLLPAWAGLAGLFSKFSTVAHGIPCFFAPNPLSWQGVHANVGIEAASYYSMAPLRRTLGDLVDFDAMSRGTTRLTVGAVNVRTGCMRYFDSRDTRIGPEHVIASGALPPAFPAIRIDGEPYWDGGIYSNTPIEAVLDDNPRRDSLIFAVSVWPPAGAEPESIWQVMGRHKDIQYASKADSHIARQKQIHRLRHVIRELAQLVPEGSDRAAAQELAAWGCSTTVHVVRLLAPRLDGEDHTKDVDFAQASVRERWQAGYAHTLRAIGSAPWTAPADPIEGVILHDAAA